MENGGRAKLFRGETIQLHVVIEKDIYALARQAASNSGLFLSQWVRQAIIEKLKREGYHVRPKGSLDNGIVQPEDV